MKTEESIWMVGLVNMICCGKVLCNVIHSAISGWWEIECHPVDVYS